jgi:beta-mannosidase
MVSFAPYKHQELPEPSLSAAVADAGSTWQVTVKAEKLARFVDVRLEDQAPEAIWSDNYFDLPAGGEQTVTLTKCPGETLEQIRSRLRLRSLRETY